MRPNRLPPLSIFARIAIANSIVIVIGAVAGTLLTHLLTDVAADIWLIMLFATAGILLSVTVNFLLIRAALKPLRQLRQAVDRIQSRQESLEHLPLDDPDPDLNQLATALLYLLTQLDKNNRQLRVLSDRVILAQEEERRNIARSLHDDTGQSLSMLIINLERLENRIAEAHPDLRSKVSATRQLAGQILKELRKVIFGLRPSILDDLGLGPAIRWYARSSLEEAGIQAEIVVPEEHIPLPARLTTNLFRIAQEAVNNIVRHSQAQQATIIIKKDEHEISMRIEDDGRGFDLLQPNPDTAHSKPWGLIGIRERAELIGGELTITSEPGLGTIIHVTVPLQPQIEAPDG